MIFPGIVVGRSQGLTCTLCVLGCTVEMDISSLLPDCGRLDLALGLGLYLVLHDK